MLPRINTHQYIYISNYSEKAQIDLQLYKNIYFVGEVIQFKVSGIPPPTLTLKDLITNQLVANQYPPPINIYIYILFMRSCLYILFMKYIYIYCL